jgi:hypothetical protein
MGYFKLKSGAFTTGEGKDLKFYTANDPTNNVVQSDQNLEQRFPEMFQEVEQPPSPQRAVGMYGIEKPPPPATPEEAQLQALMLQPITREEMKARADKLRQMADALEQRSQEGQQQDQTGKEWQQAAQEHGQTPTVQTDDPMRPGRSTPGVPMQGPGQAPVPPQQQRERDLQQAKDLEQKGRAEQEQQKADQIAQQRQQAQGQQPQGQQGQQSPPPPQQTAKQEMKLRYAALPPTQQREEDVKLERATVEQLRAVAEEEEVDVPKNASKAQLIQAIRQNRK